MSSGLPKYEGYIDLKGLGPSLEFNRYLLNALGSSGPEDSSTHDAWTGIESDICNSVESSMKDGIDKNIGQEH